ncbi:MAG: preprotein translocase subunit YajC [Rubritalea sp.]|jgi:preprotein translocase subunit YajC|tara:strand:+ start:10443 stop:10784 length:342 start_codon:yes stop_codon:yes gene_type:complete
MNTINTFEIIANKGAAGMSQIIFFVLLFVIMWVVMIRPQQKRAKALRERQSSLKKGDNVVTIGGMHATVNAISDNTVSLRLSEGVFVKYDKSAIANVLPKGGEKTEKAEKSAK